MVAAPGPVRPGTGVELWLEFIITPGRLLGTAESGHEHLVLQEKSFLEGEGGIRECSM